MILEVAVLNVRHGHEVEFEAAFAGSREIIAASPGCRSHHLKRCMETPGRYLLLVEWRTLEDHTVGFRQSAAYAEWKKRLHHFYHPFPVVEHFVEVS